MKKNINTLFVVLLVILVSFTVFSCKNKSNNSTGSITETLNTPSSSNTSNNSNISESATDYDKMMGALNSLVKSDTRLGTEYFKFPPVTSWSKLPDASVWQNMGMIDLTPDEYENGAIYDDGAVLTEGFWNGFVYECESAEESYEKLINKVWDAGYRGEPIGNGTIVEADEIDDLIGYDNEFNAFYEFKGFKLCVNIKYSSWSGKLYAGIYDAKTMIKDYPMLEELPKVNWSLAKEALPKGGLDSIGTDLHGRWDDTEKVIYSYNVSRNQFNTYIDKLSKRGDLYTEIYEEGDSWEEWFVYYSEPVSDSYNGLSVYYNEKANMVCWAWF